MQWFATLKCTLKIKNCGLQVALAESIGLNACSENYVRGEGKCLKR